jgi:hypothetical protein
MRCGLGRHVPRLKNAPALCRTVREPPENIPTETFRIGQIIRGKP